MQHVDPVRVHVRVLARLLAEPRPRLGVVPGDIFSPLTTADRLPRLVDLAPTDRILLASDGFQELELYLVRRRGPANAWEKVRSTQAAAGARASWLKGVQHGIFERNARALCGL